MNLTELCKDAEAFETDVWAVDGILRVELTTRRIFDPCAGTGVIPLVCQQHGLIADAIDKVDWTKHLPFDAIKWHGVRVHDFFDWRPSLEGQTVIMNPPFSLATDFVDHAQQLGARKIICFQRQAWRESDGRRAWWEKNPPARVWVCGARATCWRFDLLNCQHPDGVEHCANAKRRGKKLETQGCSKCLGGVPTSHAWHIWEYGHKGAEVTGAIYPQRSAPC